MISSLLNRYYLMRAYGSFRKLFRCRLRSLFRPDALPELVLCFVNSVSNRESYLIGQAESRRDPFTRLPASALLDSARQCCISGYLNQFAFKGQIFAVKRMIGIECQVFIGDLYNSDRNRLSILLIHLQLHTQFWSYIGRELIFRNTDDKIIPQLPVRFFTWDIDCCGFTHFQVFDRFFKAGN